MSFTDFQYRIKEQFHHDWQEFLSSLENEPVTSIRYNPRKNHDLASSEIPWTNHGHYLTERPYFTLDPCFHQGKYYVQESSSMFIDWILDKVKTHLSLDRVLDLCAAPGGKSTIILDHLQSHQYLISNEIIPQRNSILRENLTKWGYPNFLVTENKPEDFKKIPNYFDCILLDAPCSGEGLFRKDRNARKEWSQDIAAMCSDRQFDIFKSIWGSLKEGGILIYSTCTYNPQENELLLEKLLFNGFEFETIAIDVPKEWNIDFINTTNINGYRFLPHRVKGEGFFCSVLRKKGHYKPTLKKPSRDQINSWLSNHINIDDLKDYSTYKFKNSLFLAPSYLLDELPLLSRQFYIKQIGIEVGQYQGQEIEPQQGLAMLHCEKKGFQSIELTNEQALSYLSNEVPQLNLSNGSFLFKFQDKPLGFAKIEKSKFFNLYPSGWRIRKLIH